MMPIRLIDHAGSGPAVARGHLRQERIVAYAVRAALALSIATGLAQFVDYGAFDLRFQALNSNTHASMFGAVSLLAEGVALVTALLLARRDRTLERLALGGALAVLLALRLVFPPDVVVLSIPFDCLGLALLWRDGGSRFDAGTRAIRTGCVLLGLSFVVHASELRALSLFSSSTHSWAYQVRCVVKHDAELAGWILIAAGLICAYGREPRQASPGRPPGPAPGKRAR